MPRRSCSVCSAAVEVTTKEWKLISYSGDFVCSPECILTWIKNAGGNGVAAWKEYAKINTDDPKSFRSQYELHFAEWLNANHITWFYEGIIFHFTGKTYTPDFYLPAYGVFMETKGRWGVGQKSKMVAFREHFPTVPLLVVPWTLSDEIKLRIANDPNKRFRM